MVVALIAAFLVALVSGPPQEPSRAGDAPAEGRIAHTASSPPARAIVAHSDQAPAGVDWRTRDPLGGPRPAPGPGTQLPTVGCDGDGKSGNRVQAVYAWSADRADRSGAAAAVINHAAAHVDRIVIRGAAATGGYRRVRWVTDGCALSIVSVRLPAGALGDWWTMVDALVDAGLDRGDRKYLIWADDNTFCGLGDLIDDSSPLASNRNNGGIAMYARVDRGCWDLPESLEAHELLHNLGAVQQRAPHATALGHCTDEWDLMCYEDAPGVLMHDTCPLTDLPALDCGNDDYFSTALMPPLSLALTWNAADSSFLTADPPAQPAPPPAPEPTQPGAPTPATRFAGGDRYDTAALVAQAAYPSGTPNAVVVAGDRFPDAIAASGLAGSLGAPVLLTQSDALPPVTAGALAALGVHDVTIVGGPAAVGDGVVGALRALGVTVRRVSGENRYATSAAVAALMGSQRGVVVVSGESFADALAVGGVAHHQGLPVLLVPTSSLPSEVAGAVARSGAAEAIVVGGTSAVGSGVVASLDAIGVNVVRVSGPDRTATAAAVADLAIARFGWAADEVLIARGDAFADALAGSALASRREAPLLFAAAPSELGASTSAWLARRTNGPEVTALGGAAALADSVLAAVVGLLS